jgi:hypothetical protein
MTSKEKEQLDISWLYRVENGWQFRIGERTPNYHTKSFADSGRHSDASLEEARNYRNTYLAAHPELRAIRAPVWLRLPKHNTSGILGVNYAEPVLPSGNLGAAWQMTCPRSEGRTPKTTRFAVRKYGGETRALMMAVNARREATRELMNASKSPVVVRCLQQLIGEYDDIISELKQSFVDGKDSELLTIIREARLDATSKQAQISVRIGHHRFRRLVLEHWKGRCAVTGADILVDASHIKPWRICSDFDRINPYNGIALSPLYHRAFDLRYISFADDGSILVSATFRERLQQIGMNLSARISGLTEDHRPYLEHHRKHIFRDDLK